MRRNLRSSDFRLIGIWENDEPCRLDTAADLPAFRIHVVDDQTQERVCTLQGAFAARMFCMIDRWNLPVRVLDFNCFAAVDTVLTGAPIRGDIFTRELKAARTPLTETPPPLDVPYGYQLIGPYQDFSEQKYYGVLHEGIVIHRDAIRTLVFHKCGAFLAYIETWEHSLRAYRTAYEAAYFPIPPSPLSPADVSS